MMQVDQVMAKIYQPEMLKNGMAFLCGRFPFPWGWLGQKLDIQILSFRVLQMSPELKDLCGPLHF